jgi:hypothetical protein
MKKVGAGGWTIYLANFISKKTKKKETVNAFVFEIASRRTSIFMTFFLMIDNASLIDAGRSPAVAADAVPLGDTRCQQQQQQM